MRPVFSAFLSVFSLCLIQSVHGQQPVTPPVVAAPPSASAPAVSAPAAPAYEADPKFQSAMADAKDAKGKRLYPFAIDYYKKANKIAGGTCGKCLQAAFDLQMGVGSFKDAVATSVQLEQMAGTPLEKSISEGMHGEALLAQGGEKSKPAQLEAVHTVLQSALTDNPKNLPARWTDACVMARMGKTDEASKQFSACADAASPKDPLRIRARHFAENPALSLSKMAPAFEVTALDGSRFNLDAMGGRVVLIDFWATWCGPCNEELPHLKRIAAEFAGQPLVIISVSWDSDETKWKDFIGKHEMTWLQYRDADHKLSERFGVQAIPHYFTIDSDGVLTAEMMGGGSDVEGKLKKLIKRANEAKAASPQVAAVSGSGPEAGSR